MAQQWFLDLDGVRSGPYQTPEVLGLIAEGEVLPHHRISASLRDHPWQTILEWRMDQAKSAPPSAHQEVKAYHLEPLKGEAEAESTPSTKPNPYEITWNDPYPPTAATEIGTVDLDPEAEDDEIEEVVEVLHPPPIKLEMPPALTSHSEPIPPPPAPTPAPTDKANKRDPMAEMFDILQNTRQKREAKERTPHASSHGNSTRDKEHKAPLPKVQLAQPKSSFSSLKTLGIGLLIVLAGFLLGQLYQQTSSTPKSITEKSSPVFAHEADSKPPAKAEVIDRSTDKMTIRAKVEKPVVQVIPKPQHPAGQVPLNEKDMEEIKDLKKELQELKALKDELKTNSAPALDEGDGIPMDEDYLSAPQYDGTTGAGGAAYAPDEPNSYTKPGYPSPGSQPHSN